MANYIKTNRAPSSTHLQECRFHDEGPAICSGNLKRSRKCSKKATFPEPGMMLTCRIHRDQQRTSSQCQVRSPCGFQCARLCEWIPHAFQRCPCHLEAPATCYFLHKIPIELRVRIYGYLLPDKDIPAAFPKDRRARSLFRNSGDHVWMEICRVSRQVHEETMGLLYGASIFSIKLSEEGLGMCSKTQMPAYSMGIESYCNPPRTQRLQDYQMQLMLLEQQNKKRLIMARQEQDSMMSGPSASNHTPSVASYRRIDVYNPTIHTAQLKQHSSTYQIEDEDTEPMIFHPSGSFVAIWKAPLSSKYFNLIQSFRIEICFPTSLESDANPRRFQILRQSPEEVNKVKESILYSYSDHLHKLVSRIQLLSRHITRLEILMKFGDSYNYKEEAFAAIQLLLRPFRRLYSIGHAEVRSITMTKLQDKDHEEIDYLPNLLTAKHNESLIEYLAAWSHDLEGPQPALTITPCFEAYWRLDRLLNKLTVHCYQNAAKGNPELRSGFGKFEELRHKARVAREDEDLEGSRGIFEEVMNVWNKYLDWERRFQEYVNTEIESISNVVVDGKGKVRV